MLVHPAHQLKLPVHDCYPPYPHPRPRSRCLQSYLDAWEELQQKRKQADAAMPSLVESIIRGVLRHLSISVTNIHLRFVGGEGTEPPSIGVVLPSVEVGSDSADSGADAAPDASSPWTLVQKLVRKAPQNPLDRVVRLRAAVRGLSLNVQSDSLMAGSSTAALERLDGFSWDVLMLPTIEASNSALVYSPHSIHGVAHASSYVLMPLDLTALVALDLLGERRGAPLLEVNGTVDAPLAVALAHEQLVQLAKLGEELGRMSRRHELSSCGRPAAGPAMAAREWWGYAKRAAIAYRKAHTIQLNWVELQARRRARMDHVAAYSAWCANPKDKARAKELANIEHPMELQDIIRYRRLVRAALPHSAAKNNGLSLVETELQVSAARPRQLTDSPAHRLPATRTENVGWTPAHLCTPWGLSADCLPSAHSVC